MTTTKRNTKEIPPIAKAIRTVRLAYGMGIRELGREAGVAAPQISRLERGEVRKPSIETLVSLARAFSRNPIPLLILAGYLNAEETQRRLQPLFADGAELLEDWRFQPSKGETAIAAARVVISDPDATVEQLQLIAYDVWMSGETHETLWDEAFLALAAPTEPDDGLQEIVAVWPLISRERKVWLLHAARDQLKLARHEYAEEIAALQAQEAQELEKGEGR